MTHRTLPVILVIPVFALLLSITGAAPLAAATLKVSSFPSGAQVIVDGVNTGKVTPMNISVTEGDHTITVQIPGSGWNPDTRTVTINAGNNDLSVTLLPVLTAGPPGPKGDKGDKGDQGNPGLNATRADGPCFDNANRYVDCGNGTVIDTVTGLIWLKNNDCFGYLDWTAANSAAAALSDGQCGLADGSTPGDWRLPSKEEWSATVARALSLGCVGAKLTNDAGTECFGDGAASSFPRVGHTVETISFWSSSTNEAFPGWAHVMFLPSGNINAVGFATGCACKDSTGDFFRTWPVRTARR